jgi:hypothetical protein
MGMETENTDIFALAKPLASLAAGILYFAEAGHDRLTINQAAFFLLAATADARGKPVTLTEIMEMSDGVIGRSIANSYKVLLEPSRKDFALGWLVREPDPDDERRKYLRLTPKGRDAAKAALQAISKNILKET